MCGMLCSRFSTEEREKTRFGQKIEASLRTLEYPELPLVQAYLKKKAGKPVSAPVVTVGPGEWGKGPMLLELQNPDSLSTQHCASMWIC